MKLWHKLRETREWRVEIDQSPLSTLQSLISNIVFLLPLVFLIACGQSVDMSEPPEIMYGQDICDNCNMIISEEKFAAAYWTAVGEARRFDDIGDMFTYIRNTNEEVANYWVHDINTGEWLRGEDAYFVINSGLTTPMGFGIVACANEVHAEALAYGQKEAVILTFDEVMAQVMAGELQRGVSHEHHAHDHDS